MYMIYDWITLLQHLINHEMYVATILPQVKLRVLSIIYK